MPLKNGNEHVSRDIPMLTNCGRSYIYVLTTSAKGYARQNNSTAAVITILWYKQRIVLCVLSLTPLRCSDLNQRQWYGDQKILILFFLASGEMIEKEFLIVLLLTWYLWMKISTELRCKPSLQAFKRAISMMDLTKVTDGSYF